MPYVSSLEPVLDRTLLMANNDGHHFACSIIRNVLRALTLTYPNELRSVADGYDRPIKEYLPIRCVYNMLTSLTETLTLHYISCRDWGRPGNIHDLKLTWHLPSKAEVNEAQRLVNKYMGRQLDALAKLAILC